MRQNKHQVLSFDLEMKISLKEIEWLSYCIQAYVEGLPGGGGGVHAPLFPIKIYNSFSLVPQK